MAEKARNEFKNTFEGKIKIVDDSTPVKSDHGTARKVFASDETSESDDSVSLGKMS